MQCLRAELAPAEYLTMIQEVALILVVGSRETEAIFFP